MIFKFMQLKVTKAARLASIIALTSASIFSQAASAQTFPDLELIVEGLHDDATKCGVSEMAIEAAMKSAARYNRINLKKNSDYILYVNVHAMDDVGICIVSVDVEIYGYDFAKFGNENKFARTVFCQDGGTGRIKKSGGSTYLLDYLKQSFDRCLSKIE
ncbi:hypothetical protein K3179_10155 [Qipengyuania sp. GH38]|uniref:hypothetical protein n=1 Tax=Qipengyuania intermedia TaxID=2867244 RepID=UPI001C86F648|nr:hypothetical protein [Qipengyuania intermedia]MBX7514903.1 hypothetical protein [Qipengyuania intermedia]